MVVHPTVYRHHRGHRTVQIIYKGESESYFVGVWPRRPDDPFSTNAVHRRFSTFEEATAFGDPLAHSDCDGACMPWAPDPRVDYVETFELRGPHCEVCGWPQVQFAVGHPSRRGTVHKTCQNVDCPSFDRDSIDGMEILRMLARSARHRFTKSNGLRAVIRECALAQRFQFLLVIDGKILEVATFELHRELEFRTAVQRTINQLLADGWLEDATRDATHSGTSTS